MQVEIVSRKLIKPSTPTPSHLRQFKLSQFDLLLPPTYVNLILYYYSSNGDDSTRAENARRFSVSLSESLTKFYPLAGRLIIDNLMVDCNDQGAEYLEAQVNGQLDEFLLKGPDMKLVDQFVPSWDIGGLYSPTSPLLTVQMNKFACGGLALGVRVNHQVADLCTISMFINRWTTVNGGGAGLGEDAFCPSFEIAAMFPAAKNELGLGVVHNPPPPQSNSTSKIATQRFRFSGVAIQALRDACGGSAIKRQPTRVVAVSALIWKSLISLAQAKHNGHLRDCLLTHGLNLRGRRTGLPVPENCFGNPLSMILTRFKADKNGLELNELVDLLEDAMRDSMESFAKSEHSDEILSMVNDADREVSEEREHSEEVDIHHFTSWCRFPVYEADFGWGKPAWVSCASLPFEVVMLMDTKCGHGIEAWVSLNEEDLLAFERDGDILAFTS